MSAFRLNNLVVRRSVMYRVVLGFIALLYWGFNMLILVKLHNPYYMIADYSDFPEIAILILLFGSAVYFAQQPSVLEEACFVPKHKIAVAKLMSLLWCNLVLLLNPLLYIGVMSVVEKTSLLFCALVMVRVVIRWLQIMLVAQVLGFFIGYFLRNMYAYLCSVLIAVLFSFLNETIFSFLPLSETVSMLLSQFLSLNKEFAAALQVEYAGALTTGYHWMKLLTLLFLAIGVINTMVFILKKHRRGSNLIAYLPIALGLFVGISGYVHAFPQIYDPMQKLSSGFRTDAPYHIASYTGTLELHETISGEIDFTVSSRTEGAFTPLSLKLDEAFAVSQLCINDVPVAFERQGDYLLVTDETVLTPAPLSVHIAYRGRVSYINDIKSPNIFSSAFAAALPPEFAFLPLIDGDVAEHAFDLRVNANNTVISNLDLVQEDQNTFLLRGTAQTAAIFVGFLTSEVDAATGVTVYHASYLNREVFWKELQSLSDRPIMDWQTLQEVALPDLQYAKVFLIYNSYYNYNTAVAYDDYIMLNTNNAYR